MALHQQEAISTFFSVSWYIGGTMLYSVSNWQDIVYLLIDVMSLQRVNNGIFPVRIDL